MKRLLKTQFNELLKPPKIGELIEAKIIKGGLASVFLDLGAFGTGVILGKEFYQAKEELKGLKVGDKVLAKIVGLENEQGFIELSLSEARKEAAWQELEKKKEEDETLKIKILGANKGGLLAKVSGVSAFLPVSQLSEEHYPKVENGEKSEILRKLQKLVGQELEVKILDVSKKEGKLILSEKAKENERIKELLKAYKVGDVVKGQITGITDFGAFIKFPVQATKNQVEGLIHISELDWQLVQDPSSIVKPDQKLKAKIIEISGPRVFLSLKALKEKEK